MPITAVVYLPKYNNMNQHEKIPPQCIDIEMAFLGSLIIQPKLINEYSEIIETSFLYSNINRTIYSKLLFMSENDMKIDSTTLSDELRKSGHDYDNEVATITEFIVTSYALPEYAKRIVENSILRDFIVECNEISGLCFYENPKIEELIHRTETVISIAERKCDLVKISRRRSGKVASFDEYRDQCHEYKEKGFKNIGVSPGSQWTQLSKLYRPAKGMLNIFTGIPSHGKSEFVDALMINLAVEKGWKWAIYSPENWPVELHAQKFIEKLSGKSLFELSTEEFDRYYNFITEHFKIIEPDEDNITVHSVIKLFKQAITEYGIDGCLIDPWNEMDNTPEKNESLTSFIGRMLAKIRRFSRSNNVFMAVVAHPKLMYKNPKTNKYLVPRLYDISDSANWYNKADNGISIYRNFDTGYTDIHVQKIKFKVHGSIGCVSFTYDKVSGRYIEYDETAFTNETENQQQDLWYNK